MKILIIMDPGILVPPKGYGGHERLVEMFALEYTRLGHEVHLLVTKGSAVPGCKMHSFGEVGFPPKKMNALLAIPKAWYFLWKYRNEFDLIHNFGRLAYLIPVLSHQVKKIMTYGREIHSPNIRKINRLKIRSLAFTAPSKFCMSTGDVAGRWNVIYNAIDFNRYTLKMDVDVDAPLIFLSRIERLKGAHEAIKIAKETNNKLIIAGNISPLKEEQEYFKNEIEPFIDGINITYVGVLDDMGKNKYLGMAKAMIFPARTKEAFGMVMVESMACGTPVIAYNIAAMPEVIDDGITGFIVEDLKEMIEKIHLLEILDRKKCYQNARQKFHVEKIVNEYLTLHSTTNNE